MFKSALRLLPYLKPFRRLFISSIVAGLLVAAISIILPALIQFLIQTLEGKSLFESNPLFKKAILLFWDQNSAQDFFSDPKRVLIYVSLAFPIYYFFLGYLRYYNAFQARYIGELITNELRYAILSHVVNLNAKFFSKNKTGSGGLISRTLNDTMVVQQGMSQYVDLLREPFVAGILVVYMFVLNWKLSLFMILAAPLFSILIRHISRTLKVLAHQSQENLDSITKNIKETVDGIRTIQAFNLEEVSRFRFREQIDVYNRVRKKSVKRMEVASPISEFIASILIAAICIFVGQLIFRKEEDIGAFLAFIAAAGMLDKPLKKVQQALVLKQQTDASIERIFEVLDCQDIVPEKPKNEQLPFPENWKTIEFKNVSFTYGDQPTLKNISFVVNRGQSVAFVGESGSGKSTIINLMERFYDPQEGGIYIDNIDIKNFSLKELRSHLALVNQDVFLFNDTIASNISNSIHQNENDEIKSAAEKANAISFIQRLPQQFLSLAGERGAHLSGGERQRIGIARAIHKDSPILLLDEATSALDSNSEVEVQKGLQSLIKGRTTFIVAHRLSTIVGSDIILVMSQGEIVERGTHKDLSEKKGLYWQYTQLQNHQRHEPT